MGVDTSRHTTQLVILGTGGNCIDILELLKDINAAAEQQRYQCIGFLDDDDELWGQTVCGVEVLGGLRETTNLNGHVQVVSGIASPKQIAVRERIAQRLDLAADRYATLVHPTASVAETASIGSGTVVFPNVVLASHAAVGKQALLLPNSIISHDATIGSYTTVAGGVSISGHVKIGDACYIGANAGIRERLRVGRYSLVGLGSTLITDVERGSVVAGNPARRIDTSEDYLVP